MVKHEYELKVESIYKIVIFQLQFKEIKLVSVRLPRETLRLSSMLEVLLEVREADLGRGSSQTTT